MSIIKLAKDSGICAVQRFFVVDSQSVHTSLEAVKTSKPDMIEIMPGVVEKVIKYMKEKVSVPIIAGGIIEYKNDNLIIKNSTLKGGKFSSFNDHRMVMTIAILGCLIGGVEIEDIQAVNKSYPQFFDALKSIGGQFCIS